ncbi:MULTISPECIES: hypothetical protein [Pseudomonas]|nr:MULTISPECIES: hypothetical protein [Pseudomonas]
MSDSTNPPSDVCCTVVTDECDKDPAGCSNHGEDVHIHVHVHVHRHCCSAATAAVTKPVKLQVIKFGFTSVAIGNSSYPNLMAQVKEPANYGPNGTYNKIQSVDAIDAAADIVAPSITAAELKAKYDVLSVGLHNSSFTVAQADRLKEYAALGGVLLLACDNGAAVGMLNVLQRFGHTGTLAGVPVVGVYSGLSSTTENLSSYFGNSSGVTIKGSASLAMTATQLPPGSKVLATFGAYVLFWLVGGTMGRVIAFSDIELTTTEVSGTTVDNGQEKFLNNMMGYAFDQVLASAG